MSMPPKKRHQAPQGRCTPERCMIMVEAIRNGETRAMAAKRAGISRDTLQAWLRKGSPTDDGYPDDPFGKFREAVDQADAQFAGELTKIVVDAAKSGKHMSWQAALEILQRKWPAEWGKLDRSKVELTGNQGGPVEIKTSNTPKAQDAARRFLRDASNG